jgi:hypothetical protein
MREAYLPANESPARTDFRLDGSIEPRGENTTAYWLSHGKAEKKDGAKRAAPR